ncbi:MAG TPA: hypothetical protein VGD98_21610, partial [Ktedonobacteraceae bacterium]
KTTFANWLNKKLDWEMLSKDDLKYDRLANGEAEEEAGWRAFDDLIGKIHDRAIKKRKSAIIDTSNEKPFVYEDMIKVLKQAEQGRAPIHLKTILCVASKQTRTTRIHNRGSVFAPYVEKLPDILDNSKLPERFQHFLAEDPALLKQIRELAEDESYLEGFHFFSNSKVLIFNTNTLLETDSDKTWCIIEAFLKEDNPPLTR